jgi:hypothetical protein
MATSADKDDRDEDEQNTAEGDEETAKKKTASAPQTEDKKASATADDEDEDEEEGDDDDEDDDGDEEEEAAAKPAPKPTASPAKGATGAKSTAAAKPGGTKAAPSAAKRIAGPAVRKPASGKPVPPRQAGSLGKTLILFVLIVGGLAAAFAVLGREESSAPKWTVGQTIELDITLVPSDGGNLACAAAEEVAGKHCAFEAAGKPWSKGDTKDDKTLLRPYMTTNNLPFFAAGLWTNPALSASALPKDDARFTAHCKYTVEGSIKKAQVRWRPDGQWLDWNEPRHTGSISDCKLLP